MGKLTNLFLIAGAALLILVGIAAQTGTISVPRHTHGSSGSVSGTRANQPQGTVASPTYIDLSPSPDTSQAVADQQSSSTVPAGWGGGDEGDGHGHGHGHGGGGGD